ncbi:MAG TPA: aminotransferase class V-fold PLP-dependent enzyme [Candidatus Poseidoniales archaeon]|jgi:cysteine desulfurase/selenocysteine lyase|nr:MAG: selenocysteine lyase [Euryarchaeota archaeon]HIG04063.1 aminotransferase class V-fold PLP-dependent enzyme [Candidatus Poseidoniales archaeon]
MVMDFKQRREHFPTLRGDDPPIYFDNACMTLKPQPVIDAIRTYYNEHPSCGGRSVHRYANAVSRKMVMARRNMSKFINCSNPNEVIFTKNATHSLNQIAHGQTWQEGDIVLTSDREHNSNLIPWLQLEKEQGIDHRVIPSKADNTFDMEAFEAMCSEAGDNLRAVSLPQVGNLDGVEIPIAEACKVAHDFDALMIVDAAQSAPHMPVDVQALDVDFIAFSLHKMLGPSGMGALWGRSELLEDMRTISAGGNTVNWSEYGRMEWASAPHRFEGGLDNYAGVLGTGAAIEYLTDIDMQKIHEHEVKLNHIVSNGVRDLSGIDIIGPESADLRGGICSMLVTGQDSHDLAVILDEGSNCMVRSGMHCVHSWFRSRGHEDGSLRASFYFYNTEEEAKYFVDSFQEIHTALF